MKQYNYDSLKSLPLSELSRIKNYAADQLAEEVATALNTHRQHQAEAVCPYVETNGVSSYCRLAEEGVAATKRHYEGRPTVEGKPLELMTRDELLAYIKKNCSVSVQSDCILSTSVGQAVDKQGWQPSLGSPIRYTDGTISREYEEQPAVAESATAQARGYSVEECDHDWHPVPVDGSDDAYCGKCGQGSPGNTDCSEISAISEYDAAVKSLEYAAPGELGIKLAAILKAIRPYLRSPEQVMVNLEVGARAIAEAKGTPLSSHSRDLAQACAEAWGLKWK